MAHDPISGISTGISSSYHESLITLAARTRNQAGGRVVGQVACCKSVTDRASERAALGCLVDHRVTADGVEETLALADTRNTITCHFEDIVVEGCHTRWGDLPRRCAVKGDEGAGGQPRG